MNTAPKLLPCPFCGNDVNDDEGCFPVKRERSRWEVRCGNPSCFAHEASDDTQEAAIARWNNRLAPPSGEGVDAFSVMRSAFVTSESCGPEGDYRLVFRFRSLEALQQAHREWVTTPQSAPVDGMLPHALMDVAHEWYQLCERAPHATKIGISGELAEAIVKTVVGLTTPPPASQERGRLQVFHCREADDGEAGCAKWCGNRTYCPVRGEAEPSPPSSAAKCQKCGSNITFGAHDEPGSCAAEQAKPDDNMQLRARVAGELIAARDTEDGCNRIMALISTLDTYTAQTECVAAMYPAEQAKPTGDDAIREQYRDGTFTRYFGAHPSEQAQAGELPFVREALSRLAEKVAYLDGGEVTITKADACAIGQELLRRLAGGVTDAMVERALHASVPGGSEVWCWLPQLDAWKPATIAYEIMRAALVDALGAK